MAPFFTSAPTLLFSPPHPSLPNPPGLLLPKFTQIRGPICVSIPLPTDFAQLVLMFSFALRADTAREIQPTSGFLIYNPSTQLQLQLKHQPEAQCYAADRCHGHAAVDHRTTPGVGPRRPCTTARAC
jgi:hypothetical protein